jgi:hypothetical protein
LIPLQHVPADGEHIDATVEEVIQNIQDILADQPKAKGHILAMDDLIDLDSDIPAQA